MGSSTGGATARGTQSGGSGNEDGSNHKHGLLLGFLGTLPGLITAVAALITAIAGAFLGGTQFGRQPQAAPTVFVTVTATASTAPVSPSSPSQQASPNGSPQTAVGGTDLSSLTPVQTTVDNFKTGSQQIGVTTYSDAIRFSCSASGGYFTYNSLIYNVGGEHTLNAMFGIPDDAGNAAGNSATIRFYKDGGSAELGKPLTIGLDSPQRVSLNLQGISQLQISCVAANSVGTSGDDIDVAIGDGSLSPS